jgi:hypothetical protein
MEEKKEEIYGLVTFKSTTNAVQSERACKNAGLKITLIPVPRHISSDCGVCLRFFRIDRDDVIRILNDKKIEISKEVLV